MEKDFHCYNCGEKNHYSRLCPNNQEYTRCPDRRCKNVAFGPNSHKINCERQDFVSVKIGTYELPFKEFQNIRFVFQKTSSIYSVEPTATGNQTFLITKFLSLGTNVRIRRTYDNTKDLTIDMKIKPSVTLGIGRKNSTVHMASFMFCDNQVRVNHFQNIGQSGTVSFNLRTRPKKDEKHDIELKLSNNHKVVFFSLEWNNTWQAKFAMSNDTVTIAPYSTPYVTQTE